MQVSEFIEQEYFIHASSSLAKSTVAGYRRLWATNRLQFTGADLSALRTSHCQNIMRGICTLHPHLNKTTLSHIKNFFSGVWGHALRMGYTDQANPWRDVRIPAAPDPCETHAYAPEEIEVMLGTLEAPYDLLVLLAACTGLRRSEIRGLEWGDWDALNATLSVRRSVWKSHTKTTKTRASKAPVPVVPLLAARLNEYKRLVSGEHKQKMFACSTGASLDLDNVARRIIAPALLKTAVRWQGWHAFRRGLATFLHAKGVDDKTIQAILRHENVSVTQKCYVKTVPESVRRAMSLIDFTEEAA